MCGPGRFRHVTKHAYYTYTSKRVRGCSANRTVRTRCVCSSSSSLLNFSLVVSKRALLTILRHCDAQGRCVLECHGTCVPESSSSSAVPPPPPRAGSPLEGVRVRYRSRGGSTHGSRGGRGGRCRGKRGGSGNGWLRDERGLLGSGSSAEQGYLCGAAQ